ncbi:MAG: cupin domain-containing protein [Kofleriaceae bacterium]
MRYDTGVLGAWVGPIGLETFFASHLQRAPFARPGAFGDPEQLLSWDLLDAVLQAPQRPDVLVVAAGGLLPFPAPASATELRAYLRVGVGICARHCERCHPDLESIANQFERDLGTAQVQIFATAAATHGFGWHYDDEDVFIVQTAGVKDYYFRENTTATGRAASAQFERFCDETSPLHTATLVPGDVLYVPARWWHVARCRETALSISVGVTPRRAMAC